VVNKKDEGNRNLDFFFNNSRLVSNLKILRKSSMLTSRRRQPVEVVYSFKQFRFVVR